MADFARYVYQHKIFVHRFGRLCSVTIPFKLMETCPLRQGCPKFESTGGKIFKYNFQGDKCIFCSQTNVNKATDSAFSGNNN